MAEPAAGLSRLPALPVVLGVGLAARLFVALAFPNVLAADEVFQFLEQAHRLVFGAGVVPWEFQIGLRSWLIPLLLAGPMALARLADPDPAAGLALIRILLCIASLSVVWCAANWGGRRFGTRGIWIVGGLAALWPDLWLMAPHPLEEAFATYAFVPAVYLIDLPRQDQNARRIAVGGLLLGIAFVLRLQLAPAIAAAGLLLCGGNLRRWRIALPAAALPVLLAGLLDWLTWGQPFRSFWLNIYVNVFLHVATNSFGAYPMGFFSNWLILDWWWTLPFMIFLVWRGSQLLPVPAVTGCIILATHILIAHKESRFIFPALALLVPVAGMALAEMLRPDTARWPVLRAACCALGLAGAFCSPMTAMLTQVDVPAHQLFAGLAKRRPCLVSLQGWNADFLPIPPLFTAHTRFTGETIGPGGIEADAIVAIPGATTIPSGFGLPRCVPGNWVPFHKHFYPPTCVWTRPVAACAAGPIIPFNIVFPAAARPFIIRDRLIRDDQ